MSKSSLQSITYVLDRTDLNGGVKVVFQHAQMLHERGFAIRVLGNGEGPSWISFDFPYIDYGSERTIDLSSDLTIATYWSSLETAEIMGFRNLAHFCQGFEGGFPHLSHLKRNIEKVYKKNLPCLAISPHLKIFLERRFNKYCETVSPPVDKLFYNSNRRRMNRCARIVIHGVYECSWKGVPTGLQVAKRIRESGVDCEFIRISLAPIAKEEKQIFEADWYIVNESPETVSGIMRSCDLLLFPSHEQEGFGLPLLEAMACGVPFVASAIPSVCAITEQNPAFSLCPPLSVDHFFESAMDLIGNPERWEHNRRLGLRIAKKYEWKMVSEQLTNSVTSLHQFVQDRGN